MTVSVSQSEMPNYRLSVVVASNNAAKTITECLSSLMNQKGKHPVEVIVVDYSTDETPEIVESKFPEVRLVKSSGPCLIPELWSEGILQATGKIVALTTAHCFPASDWVAQILKAHEQPYPAIGGSIENAKTADIVDWAVYFCRYTRYMKPLKECFVEDIAGDNASYKRETLEAYKEVWKSGFWEPFVHRQFIDDGLKVLMVPDITIFHMKSFGIRSFIRQRFQHGYHFGRIRSNQFSVALRLLYIFGFPMIPFLFLTRIGRTLVEKRKYLSKFMLSAPIMMLFLTSWTLGEVKGYINRS